MQSVDNIDQNNPLHVAAKRAHELTLEIVKLLVEAFKERTPNWMSLGKDTLPWCARNKEGEGALHLAIRCQQDQKLALHLVSLHQNDHDSMAKLLDHYAPNQHKILFLATEKIFLKVVKTVLEKLDKASWANYLLDSSTGNNVLHHASSTFTNFSEKNKAACIDLIAWLIEENPEDFVTKSNSNGVTPLDQVVSNVKDSWILKVMLENEPSSNAFHKEPLAWLKACEKGEMSIIEVFVKCCPQNFSDYCVEKKKSPLHHKKLRNSLAYEAFFKIPYMKDLINVQDCQGRTPLHKAIEDQNVLLAEALLNIDKIRYDIKDNNDKSAVNLLEKVYQEQPEQWGHMYRSIEPILAISYFGCDTNFSEVRNTLSVVAALLATITFTAGFTLPSGFTKEETDIYQPATINTAAFLVFSLSNTIAMCLSMMVLICLIWSMVFERNKSMYLMDRSLGLLRAAIYFTLLAFVTGVYVIVSPKSFWAAIVIVFMCSLVGLSINRTLLYNVLSGLDKLFSSLYKKRTDPMHSMELGLPLLCCHRGESSNQNRTSTGDVSEARA